MIEEWFAHFSIVESYSFQEQIALRRGLLPVLFLGNIGYEGGRNGGKTREFVFSLSIVFAMSFCMEYYNLSLNSGGANYGLILDILKEVWQIAIIVFPIQGFFGGPIAVHLMPMLAKPEEIPAFIRPAVRRICTVCMMCPSMAVVSSILFKHPWRNFIPMVLTTLTFNFPMTSSIQIFLLGPVLKKLILGSGNE